MKLTGKNKFIGKHVGNRGWFDKRKECSNYNEQTLNIDYIYIYMQNITLLFLNVRLIYAIHMQINNRNVSKFSWNWLNSNLYTINLKWGIQFVLKPRLESLSDSRTVLSNTKIKRFNTSNLTTIFLQYPVLNYINIMF